MNDGQVLNEVAAAKRGFKTAETRARKQLSTAKKEATDFFANADDVGRAARHNAIKRAEAAHDEALARARIRLIDRLEDLRARAGDWADLVPRVR